MTTRSWIRKLFARTPRTVGKAAARCRPTLQTLEDRTLPSNVATTGDLVAAIQSANTVAGATTITLTANTTFDFTSANNSTDGGNAMPVVTGNVTLVGNGGTIERTGTSAFRLFDVAAGGSLTLENLTLQGGLAQGTGSAAEGGAIYSSGTLSLTGVTVLRNTAQGNNGSDGGAPNNPFTAGNGASAYGGGVYVAAGALTLNNNIIDLNQALGGNGENGHYIVGGSGGGSDGGDGGNGVGGGLYVASGSVSLSNNHLLDNSAAGGDGGNGGSGLANMGGNGGVGGSGSGGGLYVAKGSVSMNTDILFGNHAAGAPAGNHGNGTTFLSSGSGTGSGGGLYVAGGSVTLSGETFDLNFATGGGADNAGAGAGPVGVSGGAGSGGGLYAAGGAVVLNNDTFEFNSANGGTVFNGNATGYAGDGGQGSGGALYVKGAAVTMINDTLTRNNAVGGTGGNGATAPRVSSVFPVGHGDGGAGSGGGLYVASGTVTLTNDTITGNDGQGRNGGIGTSGGFGGDGSGGGVYLAGGTTNLANTLIAQNTVKAGAGGFNAANGAAGSQSAPDVSGNVKSSDHDLIGDGSGSNLSNDANGDQVGSSASPIDPKLDPNGLGSNGGPTDTVLLEPGSLAIDAGDSSAAGLPATDQRGYARIVGDGVDVGAYEAGAVAATTDLSVTGTASASVLPGGLITYTLTVTNSGATAQNNVALTDALPAHTTFMSWTTPNDWARTAPSAGSTGTASAWINSLPANTSATFTLVIRLDSDTPPFVAVINTPSVGPITGDPTPSNNTVALSTRLDYFSTAGNVYELTYDVGLAQLNGGALSIALAANTAYDFTSANNSTDGGNALPVITSNVTIAGNGSTIERTVFASFRLFDVAAGGSLTLENLTLKGGLAQGTGAAAQGGAIYNSGTVTLTNDILNDNQAIGFDGRGAFSNSGGSLPGSAGLGGGLYVAEGTVSLTDDTFFGNTAQGGHGGNDPKIGPGGEGGAGSGGGLYVAGGTVSLTNDTLFGNAAKGGAGGVGAISVLQMEGGSGGAGSGGGLYVAKGTVTLTNDTLSGNNAQGGIGGNGNLGGFGGDGSGGGVYLAGGTTNLANTLIAQNTVKAGAGGAHVGHRLGRPGAAGSQSAPDVSGNVSSSDHDLIGVNDGNTNLVNKANGDQVGTSASPLVPKLGPLQNNGGPTQTMALLPGSTAIDAGDTAVLSTIAQQEGVAVSAATDQRGVARSNSAGVDVGAFEYQAPLFTTTNKLLEAIFGASNPYSQTITATATGGAAGPVTFALAAGATLPPGLTLASNGTVSGTPTQLGQFSFTITATDSDGDVANQLFTLDVLSLTSISVSASSTAPVYGQTVTLTATVTTPAGDPTPTSSDGTVTFYDGATLLGSANLSGSTGIATLSTAALALGAHSITASYSGDSSFAASQSGITPTSVQEVVPVAGLLIPTGVAVDGKGNVFISDPDHSQVLKVAPGGSQSTVGSGLSDPHGLAVDAHGDLFIADFVNNNVVEVTPPSASQPSGSQITVASGLSSPEGVAVDSAGDVFIAETGNNQVVEVQPGPTPNTFSAPTTILSGLNSPEGVAVDVQGDVFIADSFNNRVLEVKPDGVQTTVLSGLFQPEGVAADDQGDVFIADTRNQRVVEVRPDGTHTTIAAALPESVAVDGQGDVFIVEPFSRQVVEVTAGLPVSVAPRPITVTANPEVKTAGAADPTLTYQVTAGNLVGSDAFSGNLTRDPGEAPGAYPIGQGSLTAGPNYALTFVNSVLLITATNAPLQSGQTVGVRSTAGPSTASTTPASSTSPQLSATGSGFDGSLTAAQYQGAPVVGFSAVGPYFDIYVSSSDLGTASSVQATFTNLTPGATVFWLNGGTWQPVMDTSGNTVTANASGAATVTLTTATSPSLAQLTGTDFFVGAFQPTLTAAGGPPAVIGAGVPLTTMATLAGGANEAGSITFTLYDPSGKTVDVETATVNGNGVYTTPTGFLPTVAGPYQWVAAYTSSNNFNSNASTTPGAATEVAVGSGATVVGNVLYLVGGNTNDQVSITAAGSSKTGSTGVRVSGKLNDVNLGNVAYSQAFATIIVVGFNGNDHVQEDAQLAIATSVSEGNGNDQVQLGNGNNIITLGNGNDNVNVGNGNNVVVGGTGNNKIQAGNGDNILVGGLGHDTLQAGNGHNILIDGSVNASTSVLDAILTEWVENGQSAAADIRSRLLGSVTYNTKNANTLQVGTGLDWFWATYAQDKLNQKSTDLLN